MDAACGIDPADKAGAVKGSGRTGTAPYIRPADVFCSFFHQCRKLHNLKQAANSLNFITEHQIDSYEGLESRLAEISAANDAAASALKDAERRLGDMALLIKNLSAYKQLRPVALELRNAKDKAVFRRQHESQLILYEAAAKALKEAGITKLPNLYALKTEYKKLDAERERLSAQYSEAKQKLKEYGIVKQNVDSILRTTPGKELTQER